MGLILDGESKRSKKSIWEKIKDACCREEID